MIKIHPNTHTTSQRLVAWTSFLNFSMNSIAVCVPSSWGLAQIEGTYGAKKLVKERSLPLYATFGLYYVIFPAKCARDPTTSGLHSGTHLLP